MSPPQQKTLILIVWVVLLHFFLVGPLTVALKSPHVLFI